LEVAGKIGQRQERKDGIFRDNSGRMHDKPEKREAARVLGGKPESPAQNPCLPQREKKLSGQGKKSNQPRTNRVLLRNQKKVPGGKAGTRTAENVLRGEGRRSPLRRGGKRDISEKKRRGKKGQPVWYLSRHLALQKRGGKGWEKKQRGPWWKKKSPQGGKMKRRVFDVFGKKGRSG